MTLTELIEALQLKVKTAHDRLNEDVKGAYTGDLLSDVMANARTGEVWVTLQVHVNIVAVATLKELVGIIIVNGREPEEPTVKKAQEEGVPLMLTGLSAFEVSGRLYELGIRRGDEPS
jgi:hypothetical protein